MGRTSGIAIVILLSSGVARAQPSTPGATPAVVEPDSPVMAMVTPALAHSGNLRVSVACAEAVMMSSNGLTVTADGEPLAPRHDNGVWSTVEDDDGSSDIWTATDTGYLVAPGHHRIEIAAPGCSPASFDVDAYADRTRRVSGRLAIADARLRGPVGAPNGIGFTLGVLSAPSPDHGTEPAFSDPEVANTFDPGHAGLGGWLSVSFERRGLAVAFDEAFLAAPISGISASTDGSATAPTAFTGHAYDWRSQLRVGARLPVDVVAIAAGSGVGADMWFESAQLTGASPGTTDLLAPDGVGGGFYFPMWASLTIKPSCGWGVQLLAQYDVHPFGTSADGLELGAGLLFQGSAACSEPAGVRVTTD